ncbi:MAG: glutaredoxin domain-containing protein [Anaerolineales bacterium]
MPDQPAATPNNRAILYGTPTCGMLPPVRSQLRRAGVPFDYVDITFDSAAIARVREINHGNASVPTLVFPDGTTLTEPSAGDLEAVLERLGYTTARATWQQTVLTSLENPLVRLLGVILLASGLLGTGWNIMLAGAVLLGASLLAGWMNR